MWSALQIMANVLNTAEKVRVVSYYAIFNMANLTEVIWINLTERV